MDEAMVPMKAELAESVAALLEEIGAHAKLTWTQYTPYFNDGDPCTFHAGTPKLVIGDETGMCGGSQEYDLYEGSGRHINNDLHRSVFERLAKLWDAVNDEDMLLKLFGDHTEVTIHADGTINADECDHD